MKRLTVSEAVCELFQPGQELELRDPAGQAVGHFVPVEHDADHRAGRGDAAGNGQPKQVLVHEALRTSLCGLKESLELLDGCGRVIGHFLPVQDRSMYAGVNSPTDREELLRRAREGGGRTWAEIRADLEQTA